MAFAGSGDFKCPKCGGGTWGTGDMTVPRESWIGYCHTTGCRFKWKRSEEVELGLFHVRAPSPEPAAKTELTAEELDSLRLAATDWRNDLADESLLRLLDEHAAMRTELERLNALLEKLSTDPNPEGEEWQDAARRNHSKAWEWCIIANEAAMESAQRKSRIAELESALALATEAVAAEARAKVEGLTCTREERAELERLRRIVELDAEAEALLRQRLRESCAFTASERAVLDACAKMTIGMPSVPPRPPAKMAPRIKAGIMPVLEAELARREAAKEKGEKRCECCRQPLNPERTSGTICLACEVL